MKLAEELRDNIPGLRLQSHIGGGGFKAQFKRADRSGAGYALVIGDDEAEQQRVAVKPLRGEGEQQVLDTQRLQEMLKAVTTQ